MKKSFPMASALCLLLPLLAACTPEPAARPAQSVIYTSLGTPSAQLDAPATRDLVNGYRRNSGLGPLELHPALMAEAARQAQTMSEKGDITVGARRDIKARLASAGLQAATVRESVSAGYFTIADAFSGWRGSPTHDATLKLTTGRRLGVAAVHKPGSRHNIYWAIIVSD
jgi:uncharacterized protein YkwD